MINPEAGRCFGCGGHFHEEVEYCGSTIVRRTDRLIANMVMDGDKVIDPGQYWHSGCWAKHDLKRQLSPLFPWAQP
jgi:hypothetical protein